MAFRISEDCRGCGVCRKRCPWSAVHGERKKRHLIDPVICRECGTCLQLCPTGAIMDVKGAYRGRESEVERTKSTCVGCSIGCGIEVVSRANHLVRIEGDWDAEVNAGLLFFLNP